MRHTAVLFLTLFLFSCSDNSNKPEEPTGPRPEPTAEEIIALCSQDPSLLTPEIISQCTEFKKQEELAALIEICSGDPSLIPDDLKLKCKAITDSDALTISELTELCAGDLENFPPEMASKCNEFDTTQPPEFIFEKDGSSRWSLTNLEMKNASMEKNLIAEVQTVADTLLSDFNECGLSLNGSLCLDRKVENRLELGEYLNASGELVYVVELKYVGAEAPILLEFTQEETARDKFKAKSVKAYLQLFPITYGIDLQDYLIGDRVINLFNANIAPIADNKTYSLSLSKFNEIRPLYHHLVGVTATTNFDGVFNNKKDVLNREILRRKDVITKNDNEIYQYAMMVLFKDGLKIGRNTFLSMAREMEEAKNDFLKQYVAVYLASYDSSKSYLRGQVVKALGHQYSQLRLDALRYLANRRSLTNDEENAMLLLLNDKEKTVRDAALGWARTLRPVKENLVSLKELVGSKLKDVRKQAGDLLAKINNDESTIELMKLIVDDEYDVRASSIRAIKSRPISNEMIPLLKTPLNAEYYTTRSVTVTLLEKTNSTEALILLNDRLLIETNFVLKYELQQAIKRMSKQ